MLPKLPRLRARAGRNGPRYYFDAGGKPRRWIALGADDAVARRRYDELIAAPRPPAGTVDLMLADTIEAMRGKLAPGTIANYRGYRKHLAAVFDRPEDITQADVLRYLKICPRTSFRGEIGLLSLAFAHWMDAGRLTFNPCFGVHCRRHGSKRTRLLLPAEIDAIIAATDERIAVAIELAYATGLRIGDLCRLRWADVAGVLETQKTGARAALAPSDALDAILARARAVQARVASLYVLCARAGRAWRPDGLRRHWIKACKAAGVADAHFHDLRAAAGTEVERRYGREAAREFLGHADIRTTMVYLRGLRVGTIRPLDRRSGT